MAEALGISSSIIGILHLAATVVQYISDIKDAHESRTRLLAEISSTTGILYSFNALLDLPDAASTWKVTLNLLARQNGPLAQFKAALEGLTKSLEPKSGLKKAGKAIVWPFEKASINEILNNIERQKSMFIYALQNDHI